MEPLHIALRRLLVGESPPGAGERAPFRHPELRLTFEVTALSGPPCAGWPSSWPRITLKPSYRFGLPYGTLLCISDRLLNGQVKLPGMALVSSTSAPWDSLTIGLATLDIQRGQLTSLHSRTL